MSSFSQWLRDGFTTNWLLETGLQQYLVKASEQKLYCNTLLKVAEQTQVLHKHSGEASLVLLLKVLLGPTPPTAL